MEFEAHHALMHIEHSLVLMGALWHSLHTSVKVLLRSPKPPANDACTGNIIIALAGGTFPLVLE